MLNASDGVLRATARVRPATLVRSATATRLRREALGLTRRIVDLATGHPTTAVPATASHRLPRHEARTAGRARRKLVVRRHLLLRLTSERTVPLAVAVVVLLAGIVTLGPLAVRPVGAAQGPDQGVRLAVGGGVTGAQYDQTEIAGLLGLGASSGLGDSTDDGSLYKPVAVDTTIASSSGMLQDYTVRSGDTLMSIAGHFGVSSMTVVWANHLSSTQLHVGQVLVIPPINGLIVKVAVGDTIQGLAAKYKTTTDAILQANQLTDSNLIVGQVLLMPGAKGAPLPTPKTTVTPASGSSGHGTFQYTGGAWHWPVVGGNNYISQYFWSGHPGVDIAAHYGTPIVAPLAARVIFAGWDNNGGGYQVWLNLGNGVYTGMYHMSSVAVRVGQIVARGQLVGRIGMSGWATGYHCHFEVWIGYPWQSGSYRVNPLRYF